jgi:hypothetical protein
MVSCKDYRLFLHLAAIRKRLDQKDLKKEERSRLEKELKSLEKALEEA